MHSIFRRKTDVLDFGNLNWNKVKFLFLTAINGSMIRCCSDTLIQRFLVVHNVQTMLKQLRVVAAEKKRSFYLRSVNTFGRVVFISKHKMELCRRWVIGWCDTIETTWSSLNVWKQNWLVSIESNFNKNRSL